MEVDDSEPDHEYGGATVPPVLSDVADLGGLTCGLCLSGFDCSKHKPVYSERCCGRILCLKCALVLCGLPGSESSGGPMCPFCHNCLGPTLEPSDFVVAKDVMMLLVSKSLPGAQASCADDDGKLSCEDCARDKYVVAAKYVCVSCADGVVKDLCDVHGEVHRSWGHVVKPSGFDGGFAIGPDVFVGLTHCDKPGHDGASARMKYWCSDCYQLLCSFCLDSHLKDFVHQVEPVDAVAPRITQPLQKLLLGARGVRESLSHLQAQIESVDLNTAFEAAVGRVEVAAQEALSMAEHLVRTSCARMTQRLVDARTQKAHLVGDLDTRVSCLSSHVSSMARVLHAALEPGADPLVGMHALGGYKDYVADMELELEWMSSWAKRVSGRLHELGKMACCDAAPTVSVDLGAVDVGPVDLVDDLSASFVSVPKESCAAAAAGARLAPAAAAGAGQVLVLGATCWDNRLLAPLKKHVQDPGLYRGLLTALSHLFVPSPTQRQGEGDRVLVESGMMYVPLVTFILGSGGSVDWEVAVLCVQALLKYASACNRTKAFVERPKTIEPLKWGSCLQVVVNTFRVHSVVRAAISLRVKDICKSCLRLMCAVRGVKGLGGSLRKALTVDDIIALEDIFGKENESVSAMKAWFDRPRVGVPMAAIAPAIAPMVVPMVVPARGGAGKKKFG